MYDLTYVLPSMMSSFKSLNSKTIFSPSSSFAYYRNIAQTVCSQYIWDVWSEWGVQDLFTINRDRWLCLLAINIANEKKKVNVHCTTSYKTSNFITVKFHNFQIKLLTNDTLFSSNVNKQFTKINNLSVQCNIRWRDFQWQCIIVMYHSVWRVGLAGCSSVSG